MKAVDGPLNILAGPETPSLAELERLGVARLSFGSWPFRGAMGWFRRLLREVRDPAELARLMADAIPYAEINELFED